LDRLTNYPIYPIELHALKPILVKLCKFEIENLYSYGLTVAGREHFDLAWRGCCIYAGKAAIFKKLMTDWDILCIYPTE